MNKTRIMRTYVNFSIVIGLYMLLSTFLYTYRFGTEFYGLIDVSLLYVNFENYYETVPFFNMPLMAFGLFFAFNIGIFALIGRDKDIESSALKEVSIYNSIIVLLMVISQLVYVFMIPDRISGFIIDNYIFTEFAYTSDNIVKAINLNYLLSLGYIVYNVYVSIKTMPPKEESTKDDEIDEDQLLDQFIRG